MFTSTFIGVLVSNSIYTIFILIKRYIHLLMEMWNVKIHGNVKIHFLILRLHQLAYLHIGYLIHYSRHIWFQLVWHVFLRIILLFNLINTIYFSLQFLHKFFNQIHLFLSYSSNVDIISSLILGNTSSKGFLPTV